MFHWLLICSINQTVMGTQRSFRIYKSHCNIFHCITLSWFILIIMIYAWLSCTFQYIFFLIYSSPSNKITNRFIAIYRNLSDYTTLLLRFLNLHLLVCLCVELPVFCARIVSLFFNKFMSENAKVSTILLRMFDIDSYLLYRKSVYH